MKPPDYSEIKAKVEAVRRRSIVRAATAAGILTGVPAVALTFYVFWPIYPQAHPPYSMTLPPFVFGAAICGTLFRYAALLFEWLRRLTAGKKRALPAMGDATPVSKSHAGTTDVKSV